MTGAWIPSRGTEGQAPAPGHSAQGQPLSGCSLPPDVPKAPWEQPGRPRMCSPGVTLPPCPSGLQSPPPPGRGHGQHEWPPAESRGRHWAPSSQGPAQQPRPEPGAAVAALGPCVASAPSHPWSVSPCTRRARVGSLWQAWAWPPGRRCPRTKVRPWRSPQGHGLWRWEVGVLPGSSLRPAAQAQGVG